SPDPAAAIQQFAQHFVGMGERGFGGNMIGAVDLVLRNQAERLAYRLRSVMEGSLKCDLGIVEELGIKFHFGTAGASHEEVDRAALANHIHRPLPRLRTAYGLDHYVCSALLGCERTDGSNRIVHSSNLYGFVGSEASGVFHLLVALHYSNHAQAAELCHLHEHQSDRSGADDYDAVSPFRMSFIQ